MMQKMGSKEVREVGNGNTDQNRQDYCTWCVAAELVTCHTKGWCYLFQGDYISKKTNPKAQKMSLFAITFIYWS